MKENVSYKHTRLEFIFYTHSTIQVNRTSPEIDANDITSINCGVEFLISKIFAQQEVIVKLMALFILHEIVQY